MAIRIDLQFSSVWKVGFVVEDGKDRVHEYFEKLKKKKKFKQLDMIAAELKRFCEKGPHPSIEIFAPEGEGIFAVKVQQERIYGFFIGKNFFACAAGTTKKTRKADPELLDLVKGIKRRYEEQQKAILRQRDTKKGS